jgi:hypothetical protein
MGRAPNWTMTQWFRRLTPGDNWKGKAPCSEYPHHTLPWTGDHSPSPEHYLAMINVCATCPVIIECARYAIEDAEGGFYAGVWLPWTTIADSVANRGLRRRAKAALTDIVTMSRKRATV